MDIPTYIIIFSFAASIVVIIFLKLLRESRLRSLEILTFSITIIWLYVTIFGEFVYPWANNGTCSKYLGCVSGFFGYDAFEHLFFGIAGALAIIWLCERFPKYSILHSEQWKTIIIIIAVIMLIAVLWEIIECAHDTLRMNVFHESLRNLSIHINLLDQPSNFDTMGDLVFTLLGSIIGLFSLNFKKNLS